MKEYFSIVIYLFAYHSSMYLYIGGKGKKKKKNKTRPTDPPNFHHERANQPFFFFGLIKEFIKLSFTTKGF